MQHNQNLPTSPPPALFLPPIPEMKMYNVHVPGESQSKPNIIHLWFIQFVLTFLMLQSYTCKRFLLLHVFFFIIPFCICISLIFCYKLHVYTSLFLPNFSYFFSFLHFSSLPRHFLLFLFFTYIIFSCSFNTFLIFLHNFCFSKKLLTHFSFYDFYSGFFFNWLFYVTENIYFFIYVNVYFIFFFMAFLIKTSSFLFFLLQKRLKNSFGSNIYAKNFF